MSAIPDSPPHTRIQSVDLLRGITILVMLFVNDIAGVRGTPAWMEHIQPPDADGMTFVDIVFPAFLFIVGMAIPLATRSRYRRGTSRGALWAHAIVRTISLLVIGVFMVNVSTMGEGGPLPRPVWILLMYAGVILVWNQPGGTTAGRRAKWLRPLGIAVLAVAAVLYPGSGEPGLIELRPQWWGILGLIGWSYLVAFLVYDVVGPSRVGLASAAGLLYLVYLGDAGGLFSSLGWIDRWVGIGGTLGTHSAVTVTGLLLGVTLLPESATQGASDRARFGLLFGLVLAAAATLLHAMAPVHPAFFFNKIAATPAWGLLSCAVTAWVWVALYWLVDVRGWARWTPAVEPAGRNALFAFILAPIAYALFELVAYVSSGFNPYGALGSSFAVGFPRAVLFAFSMTWLAGYLSKRGVRLRL